MTRSVAVVFCVALVAVIGLAPAIGDASAQTLARTELVDALKAGGYIIVMRHAASPRTVPDERTANPDNVTRERQLDEAGRAGAAAMGQVLRDLRVPLGAVLTSPAYRAQETVRLARFGTAEVVPELGDRGRSMQAVTEEDGKWLRNRVDQQPRDANWIFVTHLPNIRQAFPKLADGLADGDALIFGPDGMNGGSTFVTRITIEEWPELR
jgi:phosphohistidine phosphatase SixA